MRVVIINKNVDVIKAKLSEQLPGYKIEVYESIHTYNEYLKRSADRADVFIMTDNGIGDNLDKGIITFSDISIYKLFKPKNVIILNRETNSVLFKKYEFVQADFRKRGIECTIVRKADVTLEDIKVAITDRVQIYNPNARNQKAIIQVRRGTQGLGSKILPIYSTEETMLVELNTPTVPKETIKNQYMNNTVPVFSDSDEQQLQSLENMEIELVEEINADLVKYIQVSSNANSGASTTAMILAKSGAEEGKTLLVDLSYSLGLSYLAETNLHPNEYVEIDLTEMAKSRSDKVDYIIEKASSQERLHIMRSTLPLVREVGYGVLQYLVANVLSLIEHNYKYIILDMPFDIASNYQALSPKVDLIIAVSPPYMSNFVPMISKLSETLGGTYAYKNNRILIFIAGIPNFNGLQPVSRTILNEYTQNLTGKQIPITAIHVSNTQNYVQSHIFREIIEAGNELMSREQLY